MFRLGTTGVLMLVFGVGRAPPARYLHSIMITKPLEAPGKSYKLARQSLVETAFAASGERCLVLDICRLCFWNEILAPGSGAGSSFKAQLERWSRADVRLAAAFGHSLKGTGIMLKRTGRDAPNERKAAGQEACHEMSGREAPAQE